MNDVMDMVGDLSSDGRVLSREEHAHNRKRAGQCPTCGQRLFHKSLFKSKPLTVPGKALNGRCLACDPLDPNRKEPVAAGSATRRPRVLRKSVSDAGYLPQAYATTDAAGSKASSLSSSSTTASLTASTVRGKRYPATHRREEPALKRRDSYVIPTREDIEGEAEATITTPSNAAAGRYLRRDVRRAKSAHPLLTKGESIKKREDLRRATSCVLPGVAPAVRVRDRREPRSARATHRREEPALSPSSADDAAAGRKRVQIGPGPLGLTLTLLGGGSAMITRVTVASELRGHVRPGDLLVAVDGKAVRTREDVAAGRERSRTCDFVTAPRRRGAGGAVGTDRPPRSGIKSSIGDSHRAGKFDDKSPDIVLKLNPTLIERPTTNAGSREVGRPLPARTVTATEGVTSSDLASSLANMGFERGRVEKVLREMRSSGMLDMIDIEAVLGEESDDAAVLEMRSTLFEQLGAAETFPQEEACSPLVAAGGDPRPSRDLARSLTEMDFEKDQDNNALSEMRSSKMPGVSIGVDEVLTVLLAGNVRKTTDSVAAEDEDGELEGRQRREWELERKSRRPREASKEKYSAEKALEEPLHKKSAAPIRPAPMLDPPGIIGRGGGDHETAPRPPEERKSEDVVKSLVDMSFRVERIEIALEVLGVMQCGDIPGRERVPAYGRSESLPISDAGKRTDLLQRSRSLPISHAESSADPPEGVRPSSYRDPSARRASAAPAPLATALAPGRSGRLLRGGPTRNATHNDAAASVTCVVCSEALQCSPEADYCMCPDCNTASDCGRGRDIGQGLASIGLGYKQEYFAGVWAAPVRPPLARQGAGSSRQLSGAYARGA